MGDPPVRVVYFPDTGCSAEARALSESSAWHASVGAPLRLCLRVAMAALGSQQKRRPVSFRRMVLMPDPSFPGSWIPDLARRRKVLVVAAVVVQVLTARPGIGVRQLRAGVRVLLGQCADGDTDAALYVLGNGVELSLGTRGAHQYRVALEKVPADVRAQLATLEAAAAKA